MAQPLRVREPFDQQQADTLRPARPVRTRRERLAAPVGGEAALPGELDEALRRRHHADPAGQREVRLAGAQGLRGQVQRHE